LLKRDYGRIIPVRACWMDPSSTAIRSLPKNTILPCHVGICGFPQPDQDFENVHSTLALDLALSDPISFLDTTLNGEHLRVPYDNVSRTERRYLSTLLSPPHCSSASIHHLSCRFFSTTPLTVLPPYFFFTSLFTSAIAEGGEGCLIHLAHHHGL
jgi:hypothetical protein